MPKLKTHKGAAKRFKNYGDGESEAGTFAPAPHPDVEEIETETEAGIAGLVSDGDIAKVKRMIPYQ